MEDFVKVLESRLSQITASSKQELSGIRTNRPSPALLDNVRVEYAGSSMLLKQVGSVSVVPPREIDVTVWDKSMVSTVAKAIESSSLGLNPSVDGTTIRVHLPPLTDERKQELIKAIKGITEKYRIQIRAERDEVNKRVGKASDAKEVNEDQKFKLKKRIQEAVDKANAEIELVLNAKVAEISE